VRAQVFCAEEKATGKKGWIRIGANNNPKLFFFVEEVKMIIRDDIFLNFLF